MSCDYRIGVDYHKTYTASGGAGWRREGCPIRQGEERPRSLAGFLSPYLENGHVAMEASRNLTVMYGWLDELCDDVVLFHFLKVKAIADVEIKSAKKSTRGSWHISCWPI